LMLAGHVDLDELDRWVRIGWERQQGVSVPYPESSQQPEAGVLGAQVASPGIERSTPLVDLRSTTPAAGHALPIPRVWRR
jgi:hypothetical protein